MAKSAGGRRVRKCARERLGITELRPGQGEAADALLDGRDTVLVLATGAGKSAVYQMVSCLLGGLTVVVSPLLALQRDQVDGIRELGLGRAEALNSSIGKRRERELKEAVTAGQVDYLFAAPEQLAKTDVRELLARSDVKLLVVDEAHCISEWGHDFRTDYLELGAVAQDIGRPPILAMTATASPRVREEMVARLALKDHEEVVRGFDRPNVRLEVEPHHEPARKFDAVVEAVVELDGPGIVYAAERRTCVDLAAQLRERGVEAAIYHGGMKRDDRRQVQAAFMDGEVDVVVATVAFGMGIDKADVRYVLHADTPPSLDEYYQEVGRAGRDGAPALARLHWRADDLGAQGFAVGSRPLDRGQLGAVLLSLDQAERALSTNQVAKAAGLNRARTQLALLRLLDVGVATYRRGWKVVDGVDPASALDEAEESEARRASWMRSRLEMMGGYADSGGCRRAHLLAYFGEPVDGRCGNCDRCDHLADSAEGDGAEVDGSDDVRFRPQQRVDHDAFGGGTVMQVEPTAVTVLFDEVGYKTLDPEVVAEHDLLRLED
jgi:ATP-dependent DNA helicase RecQ